MDDSTSKKDKLSPLIEKDKLSPLIEKDKLSPLIDGCKAAFMAALPEGHKAEGANFHHAWVKATVWTIAELSLSGNKNLWKTTCKGYIYGGGAYTDRGHGMEHATDSIDPIVREAWEKAAHSVVIGVAKANEEARGLTSNARFASMRIALDLDYAVIAEEGFKEYSKSRGGIAADGREIPAFEATGDKVHDAWVSVAKNVFAQASSNGITQMSSAVAYHEYRDKVNSVSVGGDTMPLWHQMDEGIQAAWRHACLSMALKGEGMAVEMMVKVREIESSRNTEQ